MSNFSEAERELITKAVIGLADAGLKDFEAHDEECGSGESGDCDYEFPEIITSSRIDGEVETIYCEPRAIVDVVLDLISELRFPMDASKLDASGIPTAACPNCGDRWLVVPMQFDEETYEPNAWGTEGECYSCGTKITVCTPVDAEED